MGTQPTDLMLGSDEPIRVKTGERVLFSRFECERRRDAQLGSTGACISRGRTRWQPGADTARRAGIVSRQPVATSDALVEFIGPGRLTI